MQLDETHVTIRLRTLSEIGDLSLVMIRRYPRSFISFAMGAVIFAFLNALLLAWIPITEYSIGLDDEEAYSGISRYAAWMAVLVILETPLAGVFMTTHLGQAIFEHQPTWSAIYHDTMLHARRWLWALGIKRLVIPAMLLVAIRWGQEWSSIWDIFVPIALLLTAAVIRSSRPFIPEILLLEQCPLRTTLDSEITVKRRSELLHKPLSGELSGRFITVSLALVGLWMSVFYTLISIRGLAIGMWNFLDLVVLLVLYPLSLWIVAGLSVIVRLLNYLDTRIRLEGWEVELAIRAESMRQFGDEITLPAGAIQSQPTTHLAGGRTP